MSSRVSSSTLATSWDSRNPSKKCTKGTRVASVAAEEISVMSITSCTEPDASRANPVCRTALMSL